MTTAYHQQPTLLIGLGGIGSRIAEAVYKKTQAEHSARVFCIDTDSEDLKSGKALSKDCLLPLSARSVEEGLQRLPQAEEWFPQSAVLRSCSLLYGANRSRPTGRLAFELALQDRKFDGLLSAATELAENCLRSQCGLRISLIASLVGGTGAGIFLSVALMLREHLASLFPSLAAEIHGELILPDNFMGSFQEEMQRDGEGAAYAALKELAAIHGHCLNGGPALKLRYRASAPEEEQSVELLPFDHCFFYNRKNEKWGFKGDYVEGALFQRLFSPTAGATREALTKGMQPLVNDRANRFYSLVDREILPAEASPKDSALLQSSLFRENTLLILTSPAPLSLPEGEATKILAVEEGAEESQLLVLRYGEALGDNEALQSPNGRYYRSYKRERFGVPAAPLLHLNRSWATELADIGASSPSDSQPK